MQFKKNSFVESEQLLSYASDIYWLNEAYSEFPRLQTHQTKV